MGCGSPTNRGMLSSAAFWTTGSVLEKQTMDLPSETAPVAERIVVCATCDSVFRSHEGRQSCPCCGGDPAFGLFTFDEQPAPAESDQSVSSPPKDRPQALATPPPVPAAEESPKEDVASAAPGGTDGSPAVLAPEPVAPKKPRRRK